MAQFAKWCAAIKESVNGHEMTVLNAEPKKINGAVKVLAKLIPSQYASGERVAHLMKTLGKTAVAEFIEEKLPATKPIRSGDLGEILGTSYLGVPAKGMGLTCARFWLTMGDFSGTLRAD